MREAGSLTITSKEELREYLECELPKYCKGGVRTIFGIGENGILYKHQYLLRSYEYYLNTGKKIRAKILQLRLAGIQNKYALHIPANTCGKGLHIMHVGPILLNGCVRIGENCSLHINTAIVASGTNDETPLLDDGIVVSVGAVILGGVSLAKNIAVGANAVVNKSFYEENIAVAGVPAKKISNNGRLNWNKKKNMIERVTENCEKSNNDEENY